MPSSRAGDLDGAREARVDVEVRDVVDAGAGRVQCGARGEADRRRRVQVLALAHEPVVVGVAGGLRVDPAVALDAELDRDRLRAEDQRRRLVGLDVRVQQLGVRLRDEPVVRSGRGDLGGGALLRRPRVRVRRGDAREPGPERSEPRAVLVQRRALARPQRALEQRVHDDRRDQVGLRLLGGRRGAVRAEHGGRGGAVVDGLPRQLALLAQRAADGRERLGAADDRRRRARRRRSASRAWLTSTCGPSPPMFERSVSRGSIPSRAATSAAGSFQRREAMSTTASAPARRSSAGLPASRAAAPTTSAHSSIGLGASPPRQVAWATPTMTGWRGSALTNGADPSHTSGVGARR